MSKQFLGGLLESIRSARVKAADFYTKRGVTVEEIERIINPILDLPDVPAEVAKDINEHCKAQDLTPKQIGKCKVKIYNRGIKKPEKIIILLPTMFNSFSNPGCGSYHRARILAQHTDDIVVCIDFPDIIPRLDVWAHMIKCSILNAYAYIRDSIDDLPIVLVGHSFGGLLAAKSMADHAGLNSIVEKLIIIDSPGWTQKNPLKLMIDFVSEKPEMDIRILLPTLDYKTYESMVRTPASKQVSIILAIARDTITLFPLIKEIGEPQMPELLKQILANNNVKKIQLLFAECSRVSKGVPDCNLDSRIIVESVPFVGHSVLENPYVFADWILKNI